MNSSVYYMGKIASYSEVGMSYGMVKQALMADGMSAMMADALIKEAGIANWIGSGLSRAGGWIGRQGEKLFFRGVSPSLGGAASKADPALLNKAFQHGGDLVGRMGSAIGNAGTAFKANPGQAAWGGLKGYGKGLLMGGQGLGAGMGKATTGGMAAYGGYRMLGGGGQPQQQQPRMPQQYA